MRTRNTVATRGPAACVGLFLLGLACCLPLSRVVIRNRQRHETVNSGVSVQKRPLNPAPPSLQVSSVVQHGHILEIEGSTDPGAIVMINGEPAATIFPGNSFRQFVGPLPSGTSIISLSSQNEKGGVKTLQLAFSLE